MELSGVVVRRGTGWGKILRGCFSLFTTDLVTTVICLIFVVKKFSFMVR